MSDVIIGSRKDQTRGCKKKDKDHMEFLCELYEAQAASGRYFVHELAPEVISRMKCVTRIMAMPGTKTLEADLCMFGLPHVGPGFVKATVRTVTTARRVGMRMQRKARIDMLVLVRTTQARTWNKQDHGYEKSPEQWRSS